MDSALPLDPVVAWLARGGFIAYPTETVWGLGACADRPEAIARLFAWKGRAGDQPLAVLVASLAAAEALGCAFDANARALAARCWPGPLMLVVPCRGRFAPGVAGEGGALGIRCSPHPVARALAERLAAAGLGPLTSTSLNRTGAPPAADLAAACRALGASLDASGLPVAPDPDSGEPSAGAAAAEPAGIDEPLLVAASGYDAGGGLPSTVVDCTQRVPRIVREGAIARAQIEAILAAVRAPSVREESSDR